MTFEQQWLEYDYNPFILFSSNGKIISLNTEAQFLLGGVTHHEIFELATAYANVTFGFKTTFIELEFGRYKIFALTVGYENEDEIGIKLYQSPSFKIRNPKANGELTNIYTLVDLCISSNSISNKTIFTKEFDPTIPEIIINSNNFIKLLNKIYKCFEESSKIETKIYYRTGEYIKFENKKYSIFSIEVAGEILNTQMAHELENLMAKSNFYIDIKKLITVNIPIVLA